MSFSYRASLPAGILCFGMLMVPPWRGHVGSDATKLGKDSTWLSSMCARQRGLVDEADHCANDRPLDKVGCRLFECQFQPDVQVYMVVHHKSANREDSDQCTEAGTFGEAGTALVQHCVNHRKHQHRHEHSSHSGRHNAFYSFLDRYTAGYLRNSFLSHGRTAKLRPPRTKHATNAPRAARAIRVTCVGNPVLFPSVW